jgi:hypothetical protein
MGKLAIPRLALAMTMLGIFLIPPTASFAAPAWLEKLFSSPQHKAPKKRKPRPAARIVTPLIAPVPLPKPNNQPSVGDKELPQSPEGAPALNENPQAALPVTKPKGPVQGPPMPPPEPERPAAGVPDDAGAALPKNADTVPIPEPNPRAAPEAKRTAQTPAGPVQGPPTPPALEASPQHETPPETVPIPQPNPRTATENRDETAPAEDAAPGDTLPEPMLPDPRSALRPDPSGKLPPAEIACRERLKETGAEFEDRPAARDQAGCSMPYPLALKSLGAEIGLLPAAEMNCAMAEATARFARDVISRAAEQTYGERLKSIAHSSAYVCRPRNGTRKLSEHAFGNALDIASFKLTDGTAIAVEIEPDQKAAAFLGKLREAACGPFKTVLGPGSDPDHAEHLHFDLAPRRNGGTFCQ